MREVFAGISIYVVVLILFVVVGAGVAIFWVRSVTPQLYAGQRDADIQSRQNVVGVQAAMRQDLQDYYKQQATCPSCAQQDVYDMKRLRDQLPGEEFVPNDIEAFLATH